jgi:hypothetical protein
MEQLAQIEYKGRLLEISRDSNKLYAEYLDQLREISFAETILETLHNQFENHLTFEVLDFIVFKEAGIFSETSDYEKEGILYTTWSSRTIPFQLLLN